MLVTSVHAILGVFATKTERSKCPKCEVLNNPSHVQCIVLMKIIMCIIILIITLLHNINGR